MPPLRQLSRAGRTFPTALHRARGRFARDGYAATQDGPRTFAIRELTAAGEPVWELPLTESVRFALSLGDLAWMHDALAGHGYSFNPIALGHSQLSYQPTDASPRVFVFALERGGAVRWASWLPEHQGIRAIATTPAGELASIGQSHDTPDTRIYLHEYAR